MPLYPSLKTHRHGLYCSIVHFTPQTLVTTNSMRDEKRKGFAVDDSIVAITYNWTGLEESMIPRVIQYLPSAYVDDVISYPNDEIFKPNDAIPNALDYN